MKACLFEESEKALPVNMLILYLFSLFSHDLCIGVMSFFFIFFARFRSAFDFRRFNIRECDLISFTL